MLGKDAMKRKLIIWSAILIVLGLMVLIPPVTRQWIFGPKIKGVPLCLWVEEFRRGADPEKHRQGFAAKVAAFLGVSPPELAEVDFTSPEMLPLFLELIEDNDPQVRQHMLMVLSVLK